MQIEIFFYGLFMDEVVLANNGVHPRNPRLGYVLDYTLVIGNRASLIPHKNERAYGILMTVNYETLQVLYSVPSVADYVPENVDVVLESGEMIPAVCYNLPLEAMTGSNEKYAHALYKLAERLNFPSNYLEHIDRFKRVS